MRQQHVKPGSGVIVYATCTLHPKENEGVITRFLEQHPQWQIDVEKVAANSVLAALQTEPGWIKIWPHEQAMDGFFMARLR